MSDEKQVFEVSVSLDKKIELTTESSAAEWKKHFSYELYNHEYQVMEDLDHFFDNYNEVKPEVILNHAQILDGLYDALRDYTKKHECWVPSPEYVAGVLVERNQMQPPLNLLMEILKSDNRDQLDQRVKQIKESEGDFVGKVITGGELLDCLITNEDEFSDVLSVKDKGILEEYHRVRTEIEDEIKKKVTEHLAFRKNERGMRR